DHPVPGKAMFTAIYMRVSSNRQETRSQEADLLAFKAAIDAKGEQVRIFREKRTGTNYDRPEWQKLWAQVQTGQVQRIVVWRLDRLGRLAASGLARAIVGHLTTNPARQPHLADLPLSQAEFDTSAKPA